MLVRGSPWAIAALLLSLANAQDQAEEEKVKEKISEFRKAANRARSPEALAAAIRSLSQVVHPKVLKELSGYLRHEHPLVRITAAQALRRYPGDKEAAARLLAALQQETRNLKRNKQNQDEGHEVAVEFLNSLVAIGRKETAISLHGYLNHRNNYTFTAAVVRACGKLKNIESIEPLLNLKRQIDIIEQQQEQRNQPGQPPPPLPGVDPGGLQNEEDIRMLGALKTPVENALKEISGQNFRKTAEWDTWWKENKEKLRAAQRDAEKKKP